MTDVLASAATANWLLYKGISPPKPNLPTYPILLYLRQKLMYAFRSVVASSRRCGFSYTSSCSS